ncbi:tyrosine-type recombinase/integrase [Rhizobium binae]|uniref:tyrosine-type recombinase/integrase n=1 Tax=Rhizobium binae TaxID=1138190 RepID=UPI001C833636|nr:site-specific integrase [Rhizobium binae]MBX4944598.1 site-specific integrase [Rhizobium binae]MBX4980629.1 site-specific integrase [Rhizobium binae]
MQKKIETKLPKGVTLDRDWRTREPRYYFRAAGRKKVRLHQEPGTQNFDDEVACARLGIPYVPLDEKPRPKPEAPRDVKAGTIDWLIAEYKRRTVGKISQGKWTRRANMLEEIAEFQFGKKKARVGGLPFLDLKRRHVLKIRDELRSTPGAQNEVKRAISAMFSWAIDNDIAETNPAAKIKLLYSGDGYHTWTVPEVRQYEAKHPAGSKARLMLHLALYTGLRLDNLAVLGRQHIRDGVLTMRPGKTKKSSGVVVEIPVLPELQRTIDESQTGNLTFLITEFGKPFTTNGLGNKMRDWCDQAELFHCSTHGLRKAGATIAAENGATDEELMAIFGWTTKNQTTVYTKKARRKKIAAGAIQKLIPES